MADRSFPTSSGGCGATTPSNEMRDDLKAAVRSLRSSPALTVVALIVLMLGIGATTAIFSVVDAVVLRGLPFDEHDRLVAVGERRPAGRPPSPPRDPLAISSAAPQNYLDWAAQQQVFESMAASANMSFVVKTSSGETEDVWAQRVTASLFEVLRVRPVLGRAFSSENEVEGRDRVVVISDGAWRRRFGADPEVVGKAITLGESTYEVVGVMPPEFEYPVSALKPTEVWTPLVVPANHRTRVDQRYSFYLQTVARLKPGVSVEQAQAQMDQIARGLEQMHPVWNKDSRVGVLSLHDYVVGAAIKSWMLMLLGAVAVVLLIACANVANLFLARATSREREIGIRAALGAGRWRLVRQLMIESLLLSIAGTALSIVLAYWAIDILRTSMPEALPRVSAIALNLRVLIAAAGFSIVTGLVFGVVPATQLSKPDLAGTLKDTARTTAGSRRGRLRSALVVVEVALAVVLLVGATLFIGSFITLMRIDPGFDPRNAITVMLSPRLEPGRPDADSSLLFTQLIERVERVPGVLHVAAIFGGLPFGGMTTTYGITVPGGAAVPKGNISTRWITPHYHQAMGIPLRTGRLFDASDRNDAAPVAILNEAAATKYFSGDGAVGRDVVVAGETRRIVGVVGDVHQVNLEIEARDEIYVPVAQQRVSRGVGELLVRTSGDPYIVVPEVKAIAAQIFPDVPVRNVTTLEQLLAKPIVQRRLNMLLLGLFGLLGLVISAIGIYGVVGFAVSQRTREIGIRMALGATKAAVMRMVLTSAGAMVVTGLVLGAIASWYLTELARAFLFRLDARDPRAFVIALLVLAAAAFLASVIPARRAARVDPMIALRAE
jgi:putative ABC transport system permease protein